MAGDEIRWAPFTDQDKRGDDDLTFLLGLSHSELLGYVLSFQEDLRAVRELLRVALAQVVQLTARLRRSQQENRRLSTENARLRTGARQS